MGLATYKTTTAFSLAVCFVLAVLVLHSIQKDCLLERERINTFVAHLESQEVNEKCEKRLPKAILVGSAKSGTSAILHFLSYHPQIAACRDPEDPGYFNRKYKNKSLEWYRSLMPCSTSEQVTFEKTSNYFYEKTVALRIKQMNDKTKILIILKDPVEASISMYAMARASNASRVSGKTYEDLVTQTSTKGKIINPNAEFIQKVRHVDHVKIWLDVFGKKQVLVLDGTYFISDPLILLKEIEQFLGISSFYNQNQFIFNQTKNKYCIYIDASANECLKPGKGRAHPYVSDELRTMLSEYFLPYNLKLVNMLDRSFVWA